MFPRLLVFCLLLVDIGFGEKAGEKPATFDILQRLFVRARLLVMLTIGDAAWDFTKARQTNTHFPARAYVRRGVPYAVLGMACALWVTLKMA